MAASSNSESQDDLAVWPQLCNGGHNLYSMPYNGRYFVSPCNGNMTRGD
jgi:hypothetical protein